MDACVRFNCLECKKAIDVELDGGRTIDSTQRVENARFFCPYCEAAHMLSIVVLHTPTIARVKPAEST